MDLVKNDPQKQYGQQQPRCEAYPAPNQFGEKSVKIEKGNFLVKNIQTGKVAKP